MAEVSAGGVIIDQGQVLVLRHTRGEWIMAKGHLEAGESAAEAALREVKEETGFTAEILGRIGQTSYNYRRKNDAGFYPKVVHWFLMRLSIGRQELNVCVPEGIVEAEWLSQEEALARLTWPGDRRILRKGFALADSLAPPE